MKDEKKQNQQSRSSGWGGKRIGAGAPVGNTNAVKHGERSRQAFFPLARDNGRFTPLQLLRARNLLLAERVGELMHRSLSLGTAEWREFMLLDGILWHQRWLLLTKEGVHIAQGVKRAMPKPLHGTSTPKITACQKCHAC